MKTRAKRTALWASVIVALAMGACGGASRVDQGDAAAKAACQVHDKSNAQLQKDVNAGKLTASPADEQKREAALFNAMLTPAARAARMNPRWEMLYDAVTKGRTDAAPGNFFSTDQHVDLFNDLTTIDTECKKATS